MEYLKIIRDNFTLNLKIYFLSDEFFRIAIPLCVICAEKNLKPVVSIKSTLSS